MRRSHQFGGFCVVCLLLAMPGCGGGDSEADPAVASSEATPPAATSYPDAMEDSGGGEGDLSGMAGSGSDTRPAGEESESASTDPYGETYDSEMVHQEEQGSGTTGPDSEDSYDEYMREQGSATRGPDGEETTTEMPENYDMEMAGQGSDSRGPDGEAPGYGTEGYGSEGYGRGQPAKPLTYAEMAQQAFRKGQDTQALHYFYAHALTAEADAAKELLDKMGYNAHAKKPSLAVRWGVGIEFAGPRGIPSAFPIGTAQNIPIKTPRGGSGGEAGFGEAGGMPVEGGMSSGTGSTLPQEVKLLTGELGEKIVEQFKLRLERGDYGEVFKTPTAQPAAGAGPQGYGGEYDVSGYGDSESGYGGGPGYGGGMAAGGQQKGPRGIVPGVTLIGIGTAKELVEQAKHAGVDVLCVFKVVVTVNPRVQLVLNNTSIHLFDVATGKSDFETKPLQNVEVQRKRAEGEDDNVDKTLVALFQHIDQTWKLGPLPSIQSDQVLARIGILLSEGPGENPLRALAEMRMYQSRGLLQDDHLELAYKRLLGDEPGKLLATGTEEEKKQVLEKWVSATPEQKTPSGPRDILEQAQD